VVDDEGSWSIWDIEGRIRKRSTLELVPGKSGHIYDGYAGDPTLKAPDNADGWHRLLWASNVSTIVLCNRRHIAIFDVKSAPIRLHGTELLDANSTDWILDVKRSALNLSHLFVLTSTRIFWVEINTATEDKDGGLGVGIILSYRHFWDPNDDTMKLEALNDANGMNIVRYMGIY
jgi:RNA polymerase I-specific transcription initiation factor RRN6